MPKMAQKMPETEPAQDEPRIHAWHVDDVEFTPTTAFGRRLLELRRRAIAEGQPLLTREELEREVADRRGGVVGRDDR